MDFQALLNELKNLQLPDGEFVITSSGPLSIRGLRQSRDLDVLVSDELMNQLVRKYPFVAGPPCDKIQLGNIELIGHFAKYGPDNIVSVREQIDNADLIKGFRFVNLKLVKKFKQQMGRDKDLKDIELIDDYLKTHDN